MSVAEAPRGDVHRPSEFVAADYEFLEAIDLRFDDMDPETARYFRDREMMWAPKLSGDHRGIRQCNVCGAHYRYAVIWKHLPTGTFISTGDDCASKIDEVQASAVHRAVRGLIHAAAQYGKLAAARRAFLELPRADEALVFIADRIAAHEATMALWETLNPKPTLTMVESPVAGWVPSSEHSNEEIDAWYTWQRNRERADGRGVMFHRDMERAWKRYGHLTAGQLAAVLKGIDGALGRNLGDAVRAARDEQEAQRRQASVFVGEPKQRLELDVTVRFVKEIDGQFGTTWLYGMVSADGNTLRYFSSGSFDAEQGETLRIKGTVKAHEIYNDERQTLLTRCVRVEQAAELPL